MWRGEGQGEGQSDSRTFRGVRLTCGGGGVRLASQGGRQLAPFAVDTEDNTEALEAVSKVWEGAGWVHGRGQGGRERE